METKHKNTYKHLNLILEHSFQNSLVSWYIFKHVKAGFTGSCHGDNLIIGGLSSLRS